MLQKFSSILSRLALSGGALLAGLSEARAQSLTITSLAGSLYGYSGATDGTGPAASFYHPVGISLDAKGNLYVADQSNQTIRMVSPAGAVTTIAGSPQNSGGIDGTTSAARFLYPSGTAVDSAGNVYVADSGNSAVREI